MTKMTHTGEPGKSYDVYWFAYECDRSGADEASELLKDSLPAPNFVLCLYYSMFIVHDEWQDLVTQILSIASR